VRKQALLAQRPTYQILPSGRLIKKGVLELYDRDVSRLSGYEDEISESDKLSAQQTRALAEIEAHFQEKT
jgi:hypothetical protein